MALVDTVELLSVMVSVGGDSSPTFSTKNPADRANRQRENDNAPGFR